jgi:hypothetical protein
MFFQWRLCCCSCWCECHSSLNSFNSTLIFISPISGELRIISKCSDAASSSFSPGSQIEGEGPRLLPSFLFISNLPPRFLLEIVRSFSWNCDFPTEGGNKSLKPQAVKNFNRRNEHGLPPSRTHKTKTESEFDSSSNNGTDETRVSFKCL